MSGGFRRPPPDTPDEPAGEKPDPAHEIFSDVHGEEPNSPGIHVFDMFKLFIHFITPCLNPDALILFKQLSALGDADLAPGPASEPAKAGSKKNNVPLSAAAAEKRKRRQISRPIPAGATVIDIEDDALEGLTIPKKK